MLKLHGNSQEFLVSDWNCVIGTFRNIVTVLKCVCLACNQYKEALETKLGRALKLEENQVL